MLRRLLIISLFALFALSAGFAQASETTGEVEGRFPFKYKIVEASPRETNDVVYVFHGIGGDTDSASIWAATLEKMRQSTQPMPTVIAVTLGPQWLLINNSDSKRPEIHSLADFQRDALDRIENKILGFKIGQRNLVGISMGGFNALAVAANNPGKFTRVALISPALLTISPYATEDEIRASAASTNSSVEQLAGTLKTWQSILTIKDWTKCSPDASARQFIQSNKRGEAVPKILISIATVDEATLGGSHVLADRLDKAGLPVEVLTPPNSRHGDYDRAVFSQFLLAK